MTHTVDGMIRDILRHEGGFVNDPDDPGGPTKSETFRGRPEGS